MALALATGHASPKAMLREMSVKELGLWAALWSIDPWSQERADERAALTTYVIAETNRNPKKRANPYRPLDFMPYAQRDNRAASESLSKRFRAAFRR